MVELDIVKNVRPFNSRPHKEVDMIVRGDSTCSLLSIHDLTRRSTALTMREKAFIYLSIHDLTRRSTLRVRIGRQCTYLSIHDLTRRSTKELLFQ